MYSDTDCGGHAQETPEQNYTVGLYSFSIVNLKVY